MGDRDQHTVPGGASVMEGTALKAVRSCQHHLALSAPGDERRGTHYRNARAPTSTRRTRLVHTKRKGHGAPTLRPSLSARGHLHTRLCAGWKEGRKGRKPDER